MADLLERRHVISVLWACTAGATRFNEFRQAVGGVPPRTLSERLRDLESAGVLEREIVAANPPHPVYRLTSTGERLAAVVRNLT
jgi:DNA-binding HxlR family transcriptional regulator